jgi:RIO kinase 2
MSSSHFVLASQLQHEEYRILSAIELSMRKFEWVPLKNINFYARLDDPEKVQHWLDIVHKKGLLIRRSTNPMGYQLNSMGYDLLAVHALAEGNVVLSIGNSLGMGKESDVFQGIGPDGEFLALKFHRIGRTSFRAIKEKRDYVVGKYHTSWLYMCRISATREADHLQQLNKIGADVPAFRGHNRHVVVMKQYDGQEIQEFSELEEPQEIFEKIITNVKKIYTKTGLIHSDLGEYNIIYTADKQVIIIDWPQAVKKDHPNARMLMHRDVENVCNYFSHYNVDADAAAITRDIMGEG